MGKFDYYYRNKALYTNVAVYKITEIFWKAFNYVLALWWNVRIGKKCRFRGKTYFYRMPDSEITIGDNCVFFSSTTSNLSGLYTPCMITTAKAGAKLTIGNNCGFSGTRIRTGESIIIGNNVRCGANTYIASTDNHTDDYRAGNDKPVVIEDNVWLGMNVVVLKGVRIGENSLIGANSVVTKDIPANVVAVGCPCRVIRQLVVE